jgi:hypothetical protein
MPQKNPPTPEQLLSEVKEQFRKWRRTRKSPRPMPEELWQAAVSLSANHSIRQISRELIIDYSTLKKRAQNKKKKAVAKVSRPDFIELDLASPRTIPECIIELEDAFGAKMRMHVKNKTDIELLEFVKAFWRKGS